MFIEDIKLTIFVLLVGLLIITFLSSVQVVVAQEGLASMMFTEIMYDLDGGDDKREWVEIYNSGSVMLEINADWRFFDGSNHLLTVVQGDQILDPGEVIIIVDSVDDFLVDHIDYIGTLIDSVVKLNNTGEEIKLSLDNGETWIAQVEYMNDLGAAGDGYSLEYLNGVWSPSAEVGGNPGIYMMEEIDQEPCSYYQEEVVETVEDEIIQESEDGNQSIEQINNNPPPIIEEIVYSHEIIINELVPDPEGSDEEGEYIELFNNGSVEIDLNEWWLEDTSQKKYVLSGIIASKGYIAIYRLDSKITLNNSSGDVIRLYNPLAELVEEVQYDKSIAGQSYSRVNDNEWQWTIELTPGAVNVFPVEIIEEEVIGGEEVISPESGADVQEVIDLELQLISDIKDLELSSEVYTQGVVTVLPSHFAETYFYISEIDFDGNVNLSTGIQIYSSKRDFPDMSIGDVIVVLGKLSTTSGEIRIKVSARGDIQIFDSVILPATEEILTGEVGDDYEGGFISVIGDLVDKKSTSWYLDDDSGEIRIYINSKAGITKPNVKLGQEVMVMGIVSETKSGFRLLPRFTEDISVEQVVVEQVELELTVISAPNKQLIDVVDKSAGNPEDYLGYGLGVVGLSILSWAIKLKFF